MPLSDQQISVGTLVMGKGTNYDLIDFDPWTRTVRANQSGDRPWNHGRWSGAEFADAAVVPIAIIVNGGGVAGWNASQQALAAAFAPSSQDVELRWMLDGSTEYLMFGRPRMVEPTRDNIGLGFAVTRCAFVALDPRIYTGALSTTGPVSLPAFIGGLEVPFTVPLTVGGSLSGGEAQLVNAGTAETRLKVTIAGPVRNPRFTVIDPGGEARTLEIRTTLFAGQSVVIDTEARTVSANGDPAASRRSLAVGDFPMLKPGTSTLRFRAAADDTGTLTAEWRSAWW